ncbi:hypothetical protein [Streptomyces sp. DW26H14]|uniref:hypothetical protein n=1 Tax=Streptomyces sp. DW26H14 TaxID=3435395 RepID=UPI00403DA5C9
MLVTAAQEASDEDALYVLTATLLTPAQFPSVLGDDFAQACAALALTPVERGYGLVLGQDGTGARWTMVVDDVSLVAVAIASWDCGMEHDLSPREETVIAALPGWPLALAIAAPGLPEPHDPVGSADPLTPPDTSTWGSAQRRLGADEIAAQWFSWRQAFDAPADPPDGAESRPGPEADTGTPGSRPDPAVEVEGSGRTESVTGSGPVAGTGPEAAPEGPGSEGPAGSATRTVTEPGIESGAGTGTAHGLPEAGTETGPGTETEAGTGTATGTGTETGAAAGNGSPTPPGPSHPGVHRVLRDLHGYVEQPPPVGRVRSSFAPEGARTLRADGPGWSFVARTDDMAFVLLDDEPGTVLPVGRGPALPALLTDLDAMAVRPV